MTNKKLTGIRLDQDLLEKVKAAAREDGRTMNQQIVYYIRQALSARPTA